MPLKLDILEIEVKFYISNISTIRDKVISLGAESMGRIFETNICFEDSQKNLFKNRSLLRLRKDNRTRLTFKSLPHTKNQEKNADFKIFREQEVEVSDFAVMKSILESLGFHKERVYEKWRETFILNGVTLCIDEMPFGNFLEIEGEKEDIVEAASKTGMAWENRILSNYLHMFEIIRQKFKLKFNDITFENFKNIKLNIPSSSSSFWS